MSACDGPVLDDEVRAWIDAGRVDEAATLVVRALGPEVYGFLRAALASDADADEVFANACERVWRALPAFRWQCSLRTWVYVIARNEAARFVRSAQRRNARRAGSSQLDGVVAAVRTETRSVLRTHKRDRLRALRDELPVDDRMLLVLRVDRDLAWEDVARAFLSDRSLDHDAGQLQRESARLRKRFQLIRKRLADRARAEGLVG